MTVACSNQFDFGRRRRYLFDGADGQTPTSTLVQGTDGNPTAQPMPEAADKWE